MDDDRRAGRTGQESGDTPDCSRLGRVGVENRGSKLSDQLHDPTHRECVGRERELSLQLVDVNGLHPELVDDVLHRSFTAPDMAGNEGRLVAPLVETPGQVGHMKGRPAHVQPGYDAEDADRFLPGIHRRDGSQVRS